MTEQTIDPADEPIEGADDLPDEVADGDASDDAVLSENDDDQPKEA